MGKLSLGKKIVSKALTTTESDTQALLNRIASLEDIIVNMKQNPTYVDRIIEKEVEKPVIVEKIVDRVVDREVIIEKPVERIVIEERPVEKIITKVMNIKQKNRFLLPIAICELVTIIILLLTK